MRQMVIKKDTTATKTSLDFSQMSELYLKRSQRVYWLPIRLPPANYESPVLVHVYYASRYGRRGLWGGALSGLRVGGTTWSVPRVPIS